MFSNLWAAFEMSSSEGPHTLENTSAWYVGKDRLGILAHSGDWGACFHRLWHRIALVYSSVERWDIISGLNTSLVKRGSRLSLQIKSSLKENNRGNILLIKSFCKNFRWCGSRLRQVLAQVFSSLETGGLLGLFLYIISSP